MLNQDDSKQKYEEQEQEATFLEPQSGQVDGLKERALIRKVNSRRHSVVINMDMESSLKNITAELSFDKKISKLIQSNKDLILKTEKEPKNRLNTPNSRNLTQEAAINFQKQKNASMKISQKQIENTFKNSAVVCINLNSSSK